MQVDNRLIHALLTRVSKPARYVGGEWNSVVKTWTDHQARIALVYPDTYEIGMSNLGLGILYDLINQQSELIAERAFTPWFDMEAQLIETGTPLYSLETRHALGDFDVIGLSLQHELTFSNVLTTLSLGHIPLTASERQSSDPLVIAGGSCTYNPEPMADFIDAFVIGEGEDVTLELLACVQTWKQERNALGDRARKTLLNRLAQIDGVYVPSLYTVTYHDDGTIAGVEPLGPSTPSSVTKRMLLRLGPVPTKPIVPNLQTIHDRAMVEIQRGCSRGCRFCQAGMIYRPIRERPTDQVLQGVQEILANTGHTEVSLVSLSSSDHSGIETMVTSLIQQHADEGLAVSLPSSRIDSFSVELANRIQTARKTGLTFAPEAGTQRMRDVINKGVTEDDLTQAARAAFSNGWNRIKLYFMLGLPTETDEDIIGIADLIQNIRSLGRDMRRRKISIGVSLSTFVPKPHTPFQWSPLLDRPTVEKRQYLLRERTRSGDVKLSWSDWEATWLEALLSRGDRRLGAVILSAWQKGARFDAWSEGFHPELWHQALDEQGIDANFYTLRERPRDEILPWDHIDAGVSRQFLADEYDRAVKGELSPDCRQNCHGCGILDAFASERERVAISEWGCP